MSRWLYYPVVETFAERFRRIRKEQRLTQLEVARASGVTEGLIGQVESGLVQEPGFFWGMRAALALGTDPWVLAFGKEPKFGGPYVFTPQGKAINLGAELVSMNERLERLEQGRAQHREPAPDSKKS
ncbi:MAG: helix-turn-helix domain-containing protein [Candidatus Eremiobacter antarcticus]|nr:helix-turn-helix transcriptional regulator [Candidatus Eremiobacteraeota bacterium]MBC5808829.1 helix-turn-helix transcriptional regulator [Candidatus Eremiobacteraeota bacterium]